MEKLPLLAKNARKPPNMWMFSPLPSRLSELDLKRAGNISVPDLLKVSIIDWQKGSFCVCVACGQKIILKSTLFISREQRGRSAGEGGGSPGPAVADGSRALGARQGTCCTGHYKSDMMLAGDSGMLLVTFWGLWQAQAVPTAACPFPPRGQPGLTGLAALNPASPPPGSRALIKLYQAERTSKHCFVAMATRETRATWSISEESPYYREFKGKVLKNAERLGGVIRLGALRANASSHEALPERLASLRKHRDTHQTWAEMVLTRVGVLPPSPALRSYSVSPGPHGPAGTALHHLGCLGAGGLSSSAPD